MNKDYVISEGPYYVVFTEGKLLDDKTFQIKYQSDGPSKKDVLKFLTARHPEVARRKIKKMTFKPEWVEDEAGSIVAYVLIDLE